MRKKKPDIKSVLIRMAQRHTIDGTITALANEIGIRKENFSRYIKSGQVSLKTWEKLSKLSVVRPEIEKVEAHELIPSLSN